MERRVPMVAAVGAAAALAVGLAAPWSGADANGGWQDGRDQSGKLLFFAADGLTQDRLEDFADQGVTPGFAKLLRQGARADGHGLLTQAPPNTGAGWFTLATGAWPGVHGSTNNTFHTNNTAYNPASPNNTGFRGSRSFSSPGVLQAETLAQAAERGGKKVAQIEWAGGRSGAINGPTVDYRSFFSGRGVATNYIAPSDSESFTRQFGLQFDHPQGFAGNAPFPGAAPASATGWTSVPRSFSAPKEMRLRVIDFGTDKYGLNAYIYDSTNDRRTNYDRVLFSRTKSGAKADRVADLAEGEPFADVKVKIVGGANEGKTASFLVKVERLRKDLSQVRLFHTSVTRALATWNGFSEPGFTGSFEDYIAEKFPSSQAGDFAVLEAGIVSEDTYIEQSEYWAELYQPLAEYVITKYQPDLALVGDPRTDEIQHQFLGLVTKKLPNGARNPAYDDTNVDGYKDNRVKQRERYIRDAYRGADKTMRLAQNLMRERNLTTFVASDHGFAPQFLAIDASKVLVDLGLLSTPQTGNCTLPATETIGKAKVCYAGGAAQIYLNRAERDTATPGLQQVPAAEEAATVARIRAAFEALKDDNDWNGDGRPEQWEVIDRTYTKAEARAIPNGPKTTADMAHPTRTGDLVVFASPPYQFDGATPGTLLGLSAFFGQHGYVPDLQDRRANVNMRATFLAGGNAIKSGKVRDLQSIDLAPTAAYLLGVPAPQHSQGVVRRDLLGNGRDVTPVNIIGLNDFHGQLTPSTFGYDTLQASVGGAAQLATLFDEEAFALPGDTLLVSGGDNVGASPPISSLLEDMPTIDVMNAWGMDATAFGNHEFDFGPTRILKQQAASNFPWLSANIVQTSNNQPPSYVKPSTVIRVNGVQVGLIGATVKSTPELVAAGNTAGLAFLDEAERIERESNILRARGIKVQVVVIHEGATAGENAVDGRPAAPWAGPIMQIVEKLQNTTIDLVVAGHTHRAANTVVGKIPVVEGYNAGVSYSVAQMMVDRTGDVAWTGAATRTAKNLGVNSRTDVKAIVDKADIDTAPLRNQVIGRQSIDILRDDPARLKESAMGNMVADAMRARYPGVQAALTNSGGLRQDLRMAPTGAEGVGEITWGEVFGVLPFGNRTTILTVAYEDLVAAFQNGFRPPCGDTSVSTGRTPQFSGLQVQMHCTGTTPVIDNIWLTPEGVNGPKSLLAPGSSVRMVIPDFMYTGGDGYTSFARGTNVLQPGDGLLEVTIDYITANSPVAPVVDGRRIGP
ncbi:alkaline phosphatase family protein [Solirubrobacter sp. CPCC 204708]|uniref:Alkaline phosphatase family protein n=1 Tax=Solirubrobacter deserti TaxID=2282478 RepID=A0ABT4RGJ8_9ACTN|nr:alkaline phosphatase family protein [Solirubrobacter deserti]MBE2319622.1 alkaline phosphatase family protein [Solirubrobacter deserti]MDA0137639.1 alkaline phosphatase family protein [Solirubrobacter deserti]